MSVGRFAPSPTGPLHLGNLRTALVAWLTARRAASAFHLRVEDLEAVPLAREHETEQLADLAALGLDWDGPVIRQTDRRAAHDAAIDHLAARGLLYECFCTRREIREATVAPHADLPEGAYPGTCRHLTERERAERRRSGRPPALRLRADGRQVAFADLLNGTVQGTIDDFVVRRNDGAPAYNLAVVVDDDHQGVEQVVRGDDLLDTTPRQVLLADLLDVTPPTYLHVPLALAPDGERLAKRRGARSLGDLRRLGVSIPEILLAMATSLGIDLARPPSTAADLLRDFEPRRIARQPWLVPPQGDGTGALG
ncbi:MAG: tRNA glutamyl-Q(34) synthetase GluQRS [Acidimicrobiia bacterium]|nr:tRNA glutamyl-Q(34) synthetase GluQRS [Acidimicrobiia bacterium]